MRNLPSIHTSVLLVHFSSQLAMRIQSLLPGSSYWHFSKETVLAIPWFMTPTVGWRILALGLAWYADFKMYSERKLRKDGLVCRLRKRPFGVGWCGVCTSIANGDGTLKIKGELLVLLTFNSSFVLCLCPPVHPPTLHSRRFKACTDLVTLNCFNIIDGNYSQRKSLLICQFFSMITS